MSGWKAALTVGGSLILNLRSSTSNRASKFCTSLDMHNYDLSVLVQKQFQLVAKTANHMPPWYFSITPGYFSFFKNAPGKTFEGVLSKSKTTANAETLFFAISSSDQKNGFWNHAASIDPTRQTRQRLKGPCDTCFHISRNLKCLHNAVS